MLRSSYLASFVVVALVECALADIVVAGRTIRAQSLILPTDLVVVDGDIAGGATHPAQVVGQEARVALYEGRPIRLADIGPPAVIERNQIVQLVFQKNGLQITAEGRSLSRAAPGERVRVMNLSSRSTVSGRVDESGAVYVSR
jgi:flagella basal body P-ring formation protein FlgA